MKRILPFILAMCLLLAACAQAPIPTEPPTEAPTEATEAPTAAPTEAPAQTPTEPAGVPSPLTGERIPQVNENRPFAITINNIVDAMPQWSVSQADILCEVLAEGGITRCLAIYDDVKDLGPIGSIRSARPTLLDVAMAFDAIYVHAGGSDAAYEELSSTGWDHIDGVKGSNASKYYYRDQDRLSAGYALEHTLFITGENVIAYAQERECEMTRQGGVNYGFTFDSDGTPAGGTPANSVVVDFANSSKTTSFVYDEATGLYAASQYGGAYIDAANGKQLTFRNLIMITAETSYDSKGYRVFVDLTDEGDGTFACGGKLIPIRWSRKDAEAPFVFTLSDGSPLPLGTGKTYFAITPYGSTMTADSAN